MGAYGFPNTPFGTYRLRQLLPDGAWRQTRPPNGAGIDATLSSAVPQVSGANFGAYSAGLANDATMPIVESMAFDPGGPAQRLRVRFGEDVRRSLAPEDVRLESMSPAAAPAVVAPSPLALSYDAATHTATFTFGGMPPLANGNYRATLPAGSVRDAAGNPLPAPHVIDFFVLAGDINRDRTVNGTDFAILAGSFGRGGRTFEQGDLNGDAFVNGSDFAILAGNFGRTVPAPAAAVVPAAANAAATSAPQPPNIARRSRPALAPPRPRRTIASATPPGAAPRPRRRGPAMAGTADRDLRT
jgi:hypothetical protein